MNWSNRECRRRFWAGLAPHLGPAPGSRVPASGGLHAVAIVGRGAAFTLIELILVMALLTIVLAVSAPALSRFFHSRTLDSEARRFLALTRYAQSRAVSEGVPMTLWIKPRQGLYGLQQEPGFTDMDSNAVQFALGNTMRGTVNFPVTPNSSDWSISVADTPTLSPLSTQARLVQQTRADPSMPVLRFQPDGSIDETSPQSVILQEKDGPSIWIIQNLNRLHYEIQTNAMQRAAR